MITKNKFMLSIATVALLAAIPAMADTQAVTQKSSTVNPDGSVSYESKTVVKEVPAVPAVGTTTTTIVKGVPVAAGTTTTTIVKGAPVVAGTTTTTVVTNPVTFYYYEPATKHIVANSELTPEIVALWDTDRNKSIDNHEFYNNAMVVYEPLEYSKRTYQDVNLDGNLELTREEYTVRLQKLPYYGTINTDKKDGLTMYEFTGIGFQEADLNDDNQVSFDEIRKAFYGQARLASEPSLYN